MALSQYHQREAKKWIKSSVSEDEPRYLYQLSMLAQEEEKGQANDAIVLGVFLFIYLQVDIHKEDFAGKIKSTLGVQSDNVLKSILGRSEFTLTHVAENKKLSEIASCFRIPMISPSVGNAASLALQAAFLFFKSKKLIFKDEEQGFFSISQKRHIYVDNFLCTMLDICAYVATFSELPEEHELNEKIKMVHGFLKMIENSVMHLEKFICILKDYKINDELMAAKLVFLIVLETVYFAIQSLNDPKNSSLNLLESFIKMRVDNLFSAEFYIQDKGSEYEELRKRFLFDAMSLEGVLFKNVDVETKQFFAEFVGRREVHSSNVNFSSIADKIALKPKEALLLRAFLDSPVLINPEKIERSSLASQALARYYVSRPMAQIHASSRAIYEQQLTVMAKKENQELVTEAMLAGLFFLIILSIQTSEISSSATMSLIRNGLRPVFDRGFDDEATGSSLELILGQTLVTMPNEVKPVALSVLANSCNTPFSSDRQMAYASVAMQQVYFSMSNEVISLDSQRHTFFTPDQKTKVYRHSYLCAMHDILVYAKDENIFPDVMLEKERIVELLTIVRNATLHLAELAEQVSTIFPELVAHEHHLFREKLTCFLILSRIYVALDAMSGNHLNIAKKFLEKILALFFNSLAMPVDATQQARLLSEKFSGFNECHFLFDAVSELIYQPLLEQHAFLPSEFSILNWAQQCCFQPTLRDRFLMEDYLSRLAPLGSVANGVLASASAEL